MAVDFLESAGLEISLRAVEVYAGVGRLLWILLSKKDPLTVLGAESGGEKGHKYFKM